MKVAALVFMVALVGLMFVCPSVARSMDSDVAMETKNVNSKFFFIIMFEINVNNLNKTKSCTGSIILKYFLLQALNGSLALKSIVS